MSKEKVAIIGSGNWGSAIAKIIGYNVRRNPTVFDDEVISLVNNRFLLSIGPYVDV